MTVAHKLVGEMSQVVICQLEAGQEVYSDAGKFLWKTTNVSLQTRLAGPPSSAPAPAAAGGGGAGGFLRAALSTAAEVGKRALAGETLAFQWFQASGGAGLVSFSGAAPGQMRILELDGAGGWFAEAGSFVCAERTVNFDIALQGWRTGHSAREGFILEHFTGTGTLAIAGAGTFVELDPQTYGGTIQVHPGCIVAFQDSVTCNVERVGGLNAQTALTAAFGGEGLYLATLSGAGKVLLQSFTYQGLSEALHRHSADQDQPNREGPAGILGRL